MGLLDKMFGGGTKLTFTVDRPTGSPGGLIGGKIALQGGKKAYKVTDLSVRLMAVRVETKPGQSMPTVDMKEVRKQTVTAGEDLPPGAEKTYSFRFEVPHHAELSSKAVTYKLVATADIPGIKDPNEAADIQILAATQDKNRTLPLEEIVKRFPDLQSKNDDAVAEALTQFHLACYDNAQELLEAEPLIWSKVEAGTPEVRKNAVEAWGHLLDDRAKPEHLKKLEALVGRPGIDERTFDEVVTVACRFAEEGALPVVQALTRHPSADVRERVASQLYFNAAKKFTGKKELILALAKDQDPKVRASAALNFNNYLDDRDMVAECVKMANADPSPQVIDKCLGTFSLAGSHGLVDQAFALWEKHAQSPHEEVRGGLAQHMHWLAEKEPKRTQAIWEKLLTDKSEEVRRQAAFQFHNFHTMKQMVPFAMKMAETDPSEDVRYEVMGAMSGIADAKDLIPWYRKRLATDNSSRMQWAALSGARSLKEKQPAKELLVELSRSADPDIANAAREALTD